MMAKARFEWTQGGLSYLTDMLYLMGVLADNVSKCV
jgi:hypothetical protein